MEDWRKKAIVQLRLSKAFLAEFRKLCGDMPMSIVIRQLMWNWVRGRIKLDLKDFE